MKIKAIHENVFEEMIKKASKVRKMWPLSVTEIEILPKVEIYQVAQETLRALNIKNPSPSIRFLWH